MDTLEIIIIINALVCFGRALRMHVFCDSAFGEEDTRLSLSRLPVQPIQYGRTVDARAICFQTHPT